MTALHASPTEDTRIPVYLLTGYLGSGKTSLLKSWLSQPELANAALVINELGEVGLDNQLLSAASESTALVANACVCCTGLPGLAEALEELFWARLERRIARFPHLVIETTGLAEPAPVTQALQSSELLRERYRLAGVITCLSAATADAVLGQHAEARAQLAGADLLVITKTDLLDAPSLHRLLQRLDHQMAPQHAKAQIVTSAHASLSAAHMLRCLNEVAERSSGLNEHIHEHGHEHEHEHSHSAQALWWPMASPIEGDRLLTQIQALQTCLGSALLRLKGRVMTDQGPWLLQMAPFESAPSVEDDPLPFDAEQANGLTVIVALPLSQTQSSLLQAMLGAS